MLRIKSIEIDEFKQVTKVEFDENAWADEVVDWLNANGIVRIVNPLRTPLEKPTTLKTDLTDCLGNTIADAIKLGGK